MRRFYAILLFFIIFAALNLLPRVFHVDASAFAQRDRNRTSRRAGRARQRTDYTKFSHRTEAHLKDCNSCHKIPTKNWSRARAEDPFPDVTDFPDHPSCVNCHREQFFRGARPPICTICHTQVAPRDGPRFVFQNPGDESPRGRVKDQEPSQFSINFPHDVHQDVMALRRRFLEEAGSGRIIRASFQTEEKKRIDSCSLCHKLYMPQGESDEEALQGKPDGMEESLWPKKGAFMTTPKSHASCFNCHWRDGGARPLSNDCAACHKLLPPGAQAASIRAKPDAPLAAASQIADERIRAKWLRRESARFRHEVERHMELSCASCHLNITSINTLDPATLKVPLPSCGGTGSSCHIKTRPKAILNVEVDKKRSDAAFQCVKCHMNYGDMPIPNTHAEAVPTPKP